jgi:nucleoside-diphosphate-sugar epimerase
VINIGSREEISILELARKIKALTRCRSPIN